MLAVLLQIYASFFKKKARKITFIMMFAITNPFGWLPKPLYHNHN
jgi:hypothetical protein